VHARRRHDRRPLLICGSLGALRSQGGSRIAYAQRIEIEMRLALFFDLTRSHFFFFKNDERLHRRLRCSGAFAMDAEWISQAIRANKFAGIFLSSRPHTR
jgi:hypothetical protein